MVILPRNLLIASIKSGWNHLKIPYKIKAKLKQFTIFFIFFCDFFFMAVEIESFLLKKSTKYVDFSHSQIGFPQILIHTKRCLSRFYITYCVHIAYIILGQTFYEFVCHFHKIFIQIYTYWINYNVYCLC